MKRNTNWRSLLALLAVVALMMPQTAFAVSDALAAGSIEAEASSQAQSVPFAAAGDLQTLVSAGTAEAQRAAIAEREKTDKTLPVNFDLIAQIGTQEETGHSICCPSFSCAYADAVLDGTVNDHSYYSCSCCTWTDWGGGGSFDRYVGEDEVLLYEAYTQIQSGKPTVIHVSAGYGEHWIALIGYSNAVDPAHLTLENFTAIDPWDGAVICAAERFSLYGDGCEHISER